MLLHSPTENSFPAEDHDVFVKQTLLESWLPLKQEALEWLSFKQFPFCPDRHNQTPARSSFSLSSLKQNYELQLNFWAITDFLVSQVSDEGHGLSLYGLWITHFLWITLPQSQGIAGQFCDLSVCVCCSSASHLSPSCALVRPHLQQLLKKLQLDYCPTTSAFQYVFPDENPGTVGVFLLPAVR